MLIISDELLSFGSFSPYLNSACMCIVNSKYGKKNRERGKRKLSVFNFHFPGGNELETAFLLQMNSAYCLNI